MRIIPTKDSQDPTKAETEQVEQEQTEYRLVNQFIRRRGLKLFSFDTQESRLEEVETRIEVTKKLVVEDGELKAVDAGKEVLTVDPRYIYFEALNKKSALKRLGRWYEGKVKPLTNLRKHDPNGIKIY